MTDFVDTIKYARIMALRTMIEVAIFEGSYETRKMGVAAHALLTDKTLAEAEAELKAISDFYWPKSLATLYPELVRPPTDSVTEWNKLTEGKPHPIAIWHKGDCRAYYNATEKDRADWNTYAQYEADKFVDTLDAYETLYGCTGIDRDGNVTGWCPPKYFPEWLAERK